MEWADILAFYSSPFPFAFLKIRQKLFYIFNHSPYETSELNDDSLDS